jgi:hypothetical protein
LKTDKQIKDISDRLNAVSSSNGNGNGHSDNAERDDDYYLNLGRDPPRFYIYRQARAETGSNYDSSVTEDELSYALKRRLRMTPEARYQREKKIHWYWHESTYYNRGLEAYDGYGCVNGECIPSCRFYPEFGIIEDDEIIQDHNKLVEYYRQNNRIVEPPSEVKLQRLAQRLGIPLSVVESEKAHVDSYMKD